MTANPFSRFAPFPELPAPVADYVARRSAEAVVTTSAAPWDIGLVDSELHEPLHSWLDDVCRWLNQTYAWQPHHVIPPCWSKHEHLPYEIAAVAFARLDAVAEPGSTIVWNEQYDRFLARMNNALGKAGDDCRVGKHDHRPARFALSAWPSLAGPTAVEEGA